jgi:hypothetical protein
VQLVSGLRWNPRSLKLQENFRTRRVEYRNSTNSSGFDEPSNRGEDLQDDEDSGQRRIRKLLRRLAVVRSKAVWYPGEVFWAETLFSGWAWLVVPGGPRGDQE